MAVQVYSFVKDDKGIYRPWVPVRFSNPSDSTKSIIQHALLDTGADECVFNSIVAQQAGYVLEDPNVPTKEMQGVSKEMIMVWYHPFKIELMTPDMKSVFCAVRNTSVGCVNHNSILPILGFNNFMCHLKMTFNYSTRKIVIDNSPKI